MLCCRAACCRRSPPPELLRAMETGAPAPPKKRAMGPIPIRVDQQSAGRSSYTVLPIRTGHRFVELIIRPRTTAYRMSTAIKLARITKSRADRHGNGNDHRRVRRPMRNTLHFPRELSNPATRGALWLCARVLALGISDYDPPAEFYRRRAVIGRCSHRPGNFVVSSDDLEKTVNRA